MHVAQLQTQWFPSFNKIQLTKKAHVMSKMHISNKDIKVECSDSKLYISKCNERFIASNFQRVLVGLHLWTQAALKAKATEYEVASLKVAVYKVFAMEVAVLEMAAYMVTAIEVAV